MAIGLIILAFLWTPVLVFKFSRWSWELRGLYELNAFMLTLASGVAWLYVNGYYKMTLVSALLILVNEVYWNNWYCGTEQHRQKINPIRYIRRL